MGRIEGMDRFSKTMALLEVQRRIEIRALWRMWKQESEEE